MFIKNIKNKINDHNALLGHAACFTTYTIFGFNIVICKELMSSHLISPMGIFTFRSLGATILFWIISIILNQKEKIDKKDYLKILSASILGFFITQLTFLIALDYVTPMDCSIVSSMTPIYTMLIAAIVLKEPITIKKVSGVALSLFGVIFLIMNSAGMMSSEGVTSTKGVILLLINSLCFSMYLGMFKPVIEKYSPVTFMKWIFLFATMMALPFSAKEIITLDYSALPATYLYELAFLVFCATFITYFLIPIGQKRIRPTLVSMYAYVQPIIAITISIVIGMDILTWQKVVAAAAVFGGVIIVSFSKSAKSMKRKKISKKTHIKHYMWNHQ